MRRHRFPTLVLGLVAVGGLSACIEGGGPLTARDTFEETRALEPDGRFELENVNGRITLATWSRDEVRIEAERAAVSEEALERIQIEIDGEGDSVHVKTRFLKREGWLFGGSPGKVDYEVTVPRGARVRLKTVNGPVDVDGLSGDLEAESVNGGLNLAALAGEVRATTVNGPINATFDSVPSTGHHRFKTVNGGIEVSLPEGAGGDLEASTVNGGIDCELPLDVKTKKKRRLEGRLGPGGGTFDLSTVNGGIDVVRGLGRSPAEAG
jgi:DUF4097 and DUF4098 domain-containing protein YvlB